MRREKDAHFSSELHLGCDEDDEKVADPLQIGDKMRREDDTHSVLGDVLHEAL